MPRTNNADHKSRVDSYTNELMEYGEKVKRVQKIFNRIWEGRNILNDLLRIEQNRPLNSKERELRKAAQEYIEEMNVELRSRNVVNKLEEMSLSLKEKAEQIVQPTLPIAISSSTTTSSSSSTASSDNDSDESITPPSSLGANSVPIARTGSSTLASSDESDATITPSSSFGAR